MYLEQGPEGTLYRTNSPLYVEEGEGHYCVDWDFKLAE